MPFGIFTGVNNYGQSICFTDILMHDKSAESFIWIFNSFLKIVNNFLPKILLSDKDQAIIKTVNLIFELLKTKHVLYLWQSYKKCNKKFK